MTMSLWTATLVPHRAHHRVASSSGRWHMKKRVGLASPHTVRSPFINNKELKPPSVAFHERTTVIVPSDDGPIPELLSSALETTNKYIRAAVCTIQALVCNLVWRGLPFWFRKMIQQSFGTASWPPSISRRHVVEPLSRFLTHGKTTSGPSREAVGVDKRGLCLKALDNVEAWMIEDLIGMGIRPHKLQLYKSALTHRSAVDEDRRDLSYERFEYLGDAVLELVVRDMLFERIPTADEGILTFQAQSLVRGDSLSAYAAWMGLDKYVMTNAYSLRRSLLHSPSILCDAFEALVGAIYTDKGLHAAKAFLHRVFINCPFVEYESLTLDSNFVTDLSRLSHKRGYSHPRYINMNTQDCYSFLNGSTIRYYTEQVYMNGKLHGIGQSYDKRIAQQFAAKATLRHMSNQ